MNDPSFYVFRDEHIPSHDYMLPPVASIIDQETGRAQSRIFELGCGKGDLAAALAARGHLICGVDPSVDGIKLAKTRYPHLKLVHGSTDDHLADVYGRFPIAISIDVVEYVYSPKRFGKVMYDLVEPGGVAIVTAPYHGYLKNIAIAVSGSMDRHFNSLQEVGRIKFWSPATLKTLLLSAGFDAVEIRRVGRVPPLAKAMIAIARR